MSVKFSGFVVRAAALAFAISCVAVPAYILIAFVMLTIRLNVAADLSVKLGPFLIAIVLPALAVMAALFLTWRLLARWSEKFSDEGPYSG